MSNIEVYAPLVDGSLFPLHDVGEGCNLLVATVLGDDLRPPPRSLTIKVATKGGKTVELIIPNDHQATAIVRVDGEDI